VKVLPVKGLRIDAGWSEEKMIVLFAAFLVMLAGFVGLVKDRFVLNGKHRFALQFLEKLHEYIKSVGADSETYAWLIKRSDRLQRQLDPDGSACISMPGTYYDTCPVIANMLAELRSSFSHTSFPRANLPGQYGNALIDLIMRHVGEIEDLKREQISRLLNPFIWLREGVRSVLALPLTIMHWLGTVSGQNLQKSMESLFFQALSAVVTITGLAAALIILLIGWRQFAGFIRTLPGWVKTFF